MLYLDFTPTLTVQESLELIHWARDELDPFTRFPYEFSGELRRAALAQSVHHSTRLEGNTLTIEQVQSVLAGRPVSAPADQVREVENYRDAISFVQVVGHRTGVAHHRGDHSHRPLLGLQEPARELRTRKVPYRAELRG